ncbi:hypothetical protein FVE85_4830 [Porphyridium purpureum]|uniref:DUF1995 domain-containing protein n=1 Tax=Porphyridium purpureum TaxID=35688 RepID=A0A5J4YSA4_PORPP|nr:hypothetical protein FVE85_4830 [Porphyridium purpureum]|eukprot:POR7469..scf236_6
MCGWCPELVPGCRMNKQRVAMKLPECAAWHAVPRVAVRPPTRGNCSCRVAPRMAQKTSKTGKVRAVPSALPGASAKRTRRSSASAASAPSASPGTKAAGTEKKREKAASPKPGTRGRPHVKEPLPWDDSETTEPIFQRQMSLRYAKRMYPRVAENADSDADGENMKKLEQMEALHRAQRLAAQEVASKEQFPRNWGQVATEAAENLLLALADEKHDRLLVEVVHPSLMPLERSRRQTLVPNAVDLVVGVLSRMLADVVLDSIALYVTCDRDKAVMEECLASPIFRKVRVLSIESLARLVDEKNNDKLASKMQVHDLTICAFLTNQIPGCFGKNLEVIQYIHYQPWRGRRPVVLLNPDLLSMNAMLHPRIPERDTNFSAFLQLRLLDSLQPSESYVEVNVANHAPMILADYEPVFFFNPTCVETGHLRGALIKRYTLPWQVYGLSHEMLTRKNTVAERFDLLTESDDPPFRDEVLGDVASWSNIAER